MLVKSQTEELNQFTIQEALDLLQFQQHFKGRILNDIDRKIVFPIKRHFEVSLSIFLKRAITEQRIFMTKGEKFSFDGKEVQLNNFHECIFNWNLSDKLGDFLLNDLRPVLMMLSRKIVQRWEQQENKPEHIFTVPMMPTFPKDGTVCLRHFYFHVENIMYNFCIYQEQGEQEVKPLKAKLFVLFGFF